MLSTAKWIGGVAAALMCACSNAAIRGPRTLPPRGSVPTMPAPAAAGGGGISRTVCRSAGIPGGYVITDYLASRACQSTAGQTYNAMLVEDISLSAVGTVMLICANQSIPRDWDPTRADVGPTSQCPRDPSDKSTSPTVLEIVRRRGGS